MKQSEEGSGLGDEVTKVLISKELGFSLGELGALGGSERRRTGPESRGSRRDTVRRAWWQDPVGAVEVMRILETKGTQHQCI